MSAARSAAKADKIRAQRDTLLADGKHYEALQLYKTAIARARTQKKWDDAGEMAMDGAAALLKSGGHDGAGCGGELAASLVELYSKSGAPCGPQQVRSILDLCNLFPAAAPAPSSADSFVDPAKDPQTIFLRVALKWSQSVAPASAPSGSGCPDLHLALARRLAVLGDHSGSHLHYIRSGGASADLSAHADRSIQEHASLLVDWAGPNGGGLATELDLFVTRAALQYLCLEDISSANALLKYCTERDATLAQSPLIHFAGFMSETCQRASPATGGLFDVLRMKYALALSRDPKLNEYLEKIGEVFFGREQPKSFMESMMGALEAKPRAAAAAVASASPPPAAAAASQAQVADEPMPPAPDVD
jgi:hypothetical protein